MYEVLGIGAGFSGTGTLACAVFAIAAPSATYCLATNRTPRLSPRLAQRKLSYQVYGSTKVLILFGTSPTGITATCFLVSVSMAETDLAAELET